MASVCVGRSLEAGANSFLATETCMRKSSHSIVIGLKNVLICFGLQQQLYLLSTDLLIVSFLLLFFKKNLLQRII